MVIGIDATIIGENREGIGNFSREILRGLKGKKVGHTFVVFTNGELSDYDRQFFKEFTNAQIVNIEVGPGKGYGYRKARKVARLGKQYQISRMLSLESHYLPTLFWPTYWVIHDISPLLHPQYFYENPKQLSRQLYKFLYKAGIKASTKILTTSEFVRDEILAYYKLPAEKVSVIGAGPGSWINEEVSEVEEKSTLDKFVLERGGYFLCLSTLNPRKNITGLLEGYCTLLGRQPEKKRKEFPKLVIAGKKGWLYESIFQKLRKLSLDHPEFMLKERIVFTDFVDDKAAKALVTNCTALVYPSVYEGFGMPPLEALILGKPIALSDIPVFRELYEGVAGYFKPDDHEEMADVLSQILKKPTHFIKETRRSEIISKYRWDNVNANLMATILHD